MMRVRVTRRLLFGLVHYDNSEEGWLVHIDALGLTVNLIRGRSRSWHSEPGNALGVAIGFAGASQFHTSAYCRSITGSEPRVGLGAR